MGAHDSTHAYEEKPVVAHAPLTTAPARRGILLPVSLPPALRSRDFRLFLSGQTVSLIGSQMQLVALTWQMYKLVGAPDRAALALGLLGIAHMVPLVVFGLWGGVVTDALERRLLLSLANGAMALASVGLLIATVTQLASPAVLYGLTALSAAGGAFETPARQALVTHLVPRDHLRSALSLHATTLQLGGIVGSGIGGLLLAWGGVVPIYLIDALSFGAVIATLVALRARPPVDPSVRISFAAAREGLRFMRRSPLILWMMVLDFFATLFGGSLLLLPIFADRLFHVGPRGLGALFAAQPIGAAVTGGLLSLRSPELRGTTVLWAVTAYGLSLALFGVMPWFVPAVLLLAISGAADTVSTVIRQTVRNLETPDELRGRMTSVNMIFFKGGPQLGEAEAGLVARYAGPRVAVASGGLVCLAVVAVVALVAPSLRRYRASPGQA
jgi:MFS family permease